MQRARWFGLTLVLCTCVGWTAEKPLLKAGGQYTHSPSAGAVT
jgi:hypothetical protein